MARTDIPVQTREPAGSLDQFFSTQPSNIFEAHVALPRHKAAGRSVLWLRAHVRDPAVVRSTLSRYHITSLHHLAISTRPQVRVLWSPWPGGPSYEVATLFEGEFMGQLGDKEGEVRDTEPTPSPALVHTALVPWCPPVAAPRIPCALLEACSPPPQTCHPPRPLPCDA